MSKISVLNYGVGNLKSIQNALYNVGAEVVFVETGDQVLDSERLIVPGVGAFGEGRKRLKDLGLDHAIRTFSDKERPLMGICLGFQLLCDSSSEFGFHEGLGLFPTSVERFSGDLRLPHVGWSPISEIQGEDMWGIGSHHDKRYYFIHSFCAQTASGFDAIYWARYGDQSFVAACAKNNIIGMQFHPEKSGEHGLEILRKFSRR